MWTNRIKWRDGKTNVREVKIIQKIVYIIQQIHSQLPQPTVAPFHYMYIYINNEKIWCATTSAGAREHLVELSNDEAVVACHILSIA